MIQQFHLKNFKGHFDYSKFKLPGLTVVSGTNNSGKSSFLQALYLTTQNKTVGTYTTLALNDQLRLGNFLDVLNKETDREDTIEFVVFFDQEFLQKDRFESLRVQLIYQSQSVMAPSGKLAADNAILTGMTLFYKRDGEEPRNVEIALIDHGEEALFQITGDADTGYCKIIGIVPESVFYHDKEMTDRFFCSKEMELIRKYLMMLNAENIQYLRAHRLLESQKNDGETQRYGLGLSGEYTAEIIRNRLDDPIDFHDQDGKQYTFSELFDLWVSELFGPEYKIRAEMQSGQYKIFVHEPKRGMKFSLNQVGSGISQLLPMLVLILSSKRGDLLLVENPELDLHPKLQAHFVDLCIFALDQSRKFVIETHSEHIINRARLRIKQKNKLLDHIRIYFFEKIEGDIRYDPITVTPEGKIEEWPENFFDQTYQDLMRLIE